MDKKREKEEWLFLFIYTLDMHIYTTHSLKLGMDQRREKEGVVIPTLEMHIYITHLLKLGMDQIRGKGSGYSSHLYV